MMIKPTPTRRTVPLALLTLLPLLAAVLLGGCGKEPGQTTISIEDVQEPRIVSLAPALTQMIVDMGRAELLVGTGENDFAAPEGLPVVGTYQNVNAEALAVVRPTHVLTMGATSTVPPAIADLAKSMDFTAVCYPYPKTIRDIFTILLYDREYDKDADPNITKSLAYVLAMFHPAQKLKYTELIRLADLGALADSLPRRPIVLMVIGLNPLVASGQNTVNDDLLAAVGGLNAVTDTSTPAPTLDREMLLQLRPEVILLMLPKAPPLGDVAADDRLAIFRGLDIPAVQNNRIHLINDPLALLPSTSVVRIGAEIAKVLNPTMSARIDEVMASDPLSKSAQDAAADTAASTEPLPEREDQPQPEPQSP